MKKKLLLSMIIIVGLLIFTGCGKPKNESNDNSTNNNIVKVNGIDLHLNKEKEFNGIKYTITDHLKEVNHDQYVQYYLYQDSGPNLLFFRIFYYENKSHDDIRKDLAIDSNLIEEQGKTNIVEYNFIDTKRTDGTIHYYIIDKDNISYVINFVSQYDIKNFEKIVMDSIYF